MGSCCRTDGDEMSVRWFWGGCGWNELLEEPRDQKPGMAQVQDCWGSGSRSRAGAGAHSSGRWDRADLKVLRKRLGHRS